MRRFWFDLAIASFSFSSGAAALLSLLVMHNVVAATPVLPGLLGRQLGVLFWAFFFAFAFVDGMARMAVRLWSCRQEARA